MTIEAMIQNLTAGLQANASASHQLADSNNRVAAAMEQLSGLQHDAVPPQKAPEEPEPAPVTPEQPAAPPKVAAPERDELINDCRQALAKMPNRQDAIKLISEFKDELRDPKKNLTALSDEELQDLQLKLTTSYGGSE